MTHPVLLAAALVALLSGCATATGPAAPPASASAPAASMALRLLFAASDEAELRRDPVEAMSRGDLRFAGGIGEPFSPAAQAAERAAAEADLAALARINRAALTPEEQISYDVFAWRRRLDLRGLQPDLLAVRAVRPLDHFNGLHTDFAQLSSGEGAAPFKTMTDYENGLSRMDGFVAALGRAEARMREGMAAGVVQPRVVTANVVTQLSELIDEGVESSTFLRPARAFPATVPAAEQARLRAAYTAAVRDEVRPALIRLRDFMRSEYLPASRETVGLLHMPGGPALYRWRIEASATEPRDPEAVHQLGLREVARIQAEMEGVKRQVGFAGTLPQFFEHIRTDPRFKPRSREELTEGYRAVERRLEPLLPRLFSTLPRTPLDIRPVPALTEKGAARGSYAAGSPDGSRPGVFYFNAYDLPSRTTPSITTLFLHEGAPGHHFQIMLAAENEALPPFQRFGGNTAFVEGWGLYAESLGRELGVLDDPYQLYGFLDSDLFRAIRLVVDTGIHAKGWTREQAINYILANSSRGRSNATAEVERYIANPGQALSYKIGALKIRELRSRAERTLGPRFDVRAFHEQVLGSGALPLPVLEAKINAWTARTLRARAPSPAARP